MLDAGHTWVITLECAIATLAFAIPAAAQPCDPHWSDEFPYGGVSGSYGYQSDFALVVFDADGPGPGEPALYAGFEGTLAGGLTANHIARWDGRGWSPLGDGVAGGNSTHVYALAVFDEDGDGPKLPALFVGGDFTSAGGQPALGIARWDGSSWSPVPGGVGGPKLPAVAALRAVDEDGPGPARPVLMVGGNFTTAGDVEAHFIARWDGASWSPLGTGLDKAVQTFEVFDDDGAGPNISALFVGGDFQYAGGKQVNRLAKWNGKAWEKWESGINAYVSSLAVMDDDGDGPLAPALYVGGGFSKIGGQPFRGVARWDGHAWDDLKGGVAGSVSALGSFDPDGDGPETPALFVDGSFATAGGIPARGSARWDGHDWSEPDGEVYGAVYAFATFDPDGPGPTPPLLYAGGAVSRAGLALPEGIVSFDDGRWRSLGAGFDGGGPTDLVILDRDGPVLCASGDFGTAGGQTAARVAQWEGDSWVGLNGGIDWADDVTIGVFDPDGAGPLPPDLYACGPYGEPYHLHHVLARWSGSAWVEVSALPGAAWDVLQFDEDGAGPLAPALFIAGSFQGGVRRWDGKDLSTLGGGVGGQYDAVYALTAFDADGNGPLSPLLIAGGYFTSAEGKPANYVAAWDGKAWYSIGKGVNTWVRDMCAVDPDGPGPRPPVLYAAGPVMTGLAEWSGSQWLYKGPGGDGYSVFGFDPDGPGPAPEDLYAGVSPEGLARRDGTKWSVVAGGMDGPVRAAASLEDPDDPLSPSLFAGGGFTRAGDQSAGHIARLLCPAKTCTADCNHDKALDLFDYLCFLGLFNKGEPAADCDASGSLDVFDFLCYANLFNAGCP